MKEATVSVGTDAVIGPVHRRLFGGFAEHLGRVVYGGLYDPDSRHSDDDGWRGDVLDAIERLGFTVMRYPGGNFASGYHWKDGIGPRGTRKTVVDEAWNSLEPNLVGTDEFLQLAARMGWEPMLTVNLGTGDADEAGEWVSYCRDLGHPVKLWCLGNEMDGEWQIGHTNAAGYVQRARAAAEKMRGVDHSIEVVACGSSNPDMPTWLEWDRTVLEGLHEHADFVSLHRYVAKRHGDSEDFLAVSKDVDRQIAAIDRVCRDVAARADTGRRAYLCFDEWNVWYRTAYKRFSDGQGGFAPALIEELYTLEDALVAASFLNSLVRRADVVRIANLAQIVNAIAPIVTIGDRLLIQSIYWPFEMFSRRRAGDSLQVEVESPGYTSRSYGAVKWLDASAILNENRLSLFLVNRGSRPLETHVRSSDVAIVSLHSAECVHGRDLGSTNSLSEPETVRAREFDDVAITTTGADLEIPAHSFTALTFLVA